MENCLVTKLKGSDPNTDLPRFQHVRIHFIQTDTDLGEGQRAIKFKATVGTHIISTVPVNIVTAYGTVIATGTSDHTITSQDISQVAVINVVVPNLDGYVDIYNKNDLTYFSVPGGSPEHAGFVYTAGKYVNYRVDWNSMMYNENLVSIVSPYSKVSTKDTLRLVKPLPLVTEITNNNGNNNPDNNWGVDLDSLHYAPALSVLKIKRTDSIGDIGNLGYCKDLTLIEAWDCNNITGEVKTMLQRMVSLGRTSGTVRINVHYPVKYNDIELTREYIKSLNGGSDIETIIQFEFSSSYTDGYTLTPLS